MVEQRKLPAVIWHINRAGLNIILHIPSPLQLYSAHDSVSLALPKSCYQLFEMNGKTKNSWYDLPNLIHFRAVVRIHFICSNQPITITNEHSNQNRTNRSKKIKMKTTNWNKSVFDTWQHQLIVLHVETLFYARTRTRYAKKKNNFITVSNRVRSKHLQMSFSNV